MESVVGWSAGGEGSLNKEAKEASWRALFGGAQGGKV